MNETPAPPRTWQPLSSVPSDALRDARHQLHWATQLIAAAGAALAEPREDDSHRGFRWIGGWFVGAPLVGRLQVSLDPETLVLALRDHQEVILEQTSLRGRTLPQGQNWLQSAIGRARDGAPPPLTLPDWDMPVHTVGHGADISPDQDALEQLARWYANAELVLSNVGFANPGADAVRGWPHHFDIATLIKLPPGDGSRTVGVGMTPGDEYYPDPYWYVSPWPYPDKAVLPSLTDGSWRTEPWTGAVLTYAETLAAGSGRDQNRRVVDFLAEAVAAAKDVAGATDPSTS